MSELAFNVNGEPFDVLPNMAAWRVRKLKPKGAPEVVYGRDGLPLFLPLDADIEDLRREARGDGRYRLDPVDDHNRPLPNAQAAYVCVHPMEREPEPKAATVPVAAIQAADTTTQLVSALLESQRQYTEMAKMYVSQFPAIVTALSGVVKSAGDAGLTTRVPLVLPAGEDDAVIRGGDVLPGGNVRRCDHGGRLPCEVCRWGAGEGEPAGTLRREIVRAARCVRHGHRLDGRSCALLEAFGTGTARPVLTAACGWDLSALVAS